MSSTTVFAFTFPIFAESDLVVLRETAAGVISTFTNPVNYSVSAQTNPGEPVPWPNGGNITLTGAVTDGKIVIKRVLTFTQGTDFPEGGALPVTSIEQVDDRNVMLMQQLNEIVTRSLVLEETDTASPVIGLLSQNLNQFLFVDSSGVLAFSAGTTDVPVSTFMGTVLTVADADAAKVTLEIQTDQASELTILGGSVTPTGPVHTIDTEADASTDDLTALATSGVIDGQRVILSAASSVRSTLVKHASTLIETVNQKDYRIFGARSITLQRRGSVWHEVTRSESITDPDIAKATMAVGTDAAHDIDFTSVSVMDSTGAHVMRGTPLTKRFDASWVAGDANGGLFNGSIGVSLDYTVFVIQKEADGSVDYGADLSSAGTANLPSGYGTFREIGKFRTDASSNIVGGIRGPVLGRYFESAPQVVTSSGTLTIAHGLGVEPLSVEIALLYVTSQNNYAVGDIVTYPAHLSIVPGLTEVRGVQITPDKTNLFCTYGQDGTVFTLLNKTNANFQTVTNANIRMIVRASA